MTTIFVLMLGALFVSIPVARGAVTATTPARQVLLLLSGLVGAAAMGAAGYSVGYVAAGAP